MEGTATSLCSAVGLRRAGDGDYSAYVASAAAAAAAAAAAKYLLDFERTDGRTDGRTQTRTLVRRARPGDEGARAV